MYDGSGAPDARFGSSLHCSSSGFYASSLAGTDPALGAATLPADAQFTCEAKLSEY